MSNIIECRSVSFSYNEGNNQTSVLKNLNFEIKSGETTAIIGQSGCGKSTLLNLMAGLDTPTDDKGGALLKSKKILTKVGLENRLNHKPSELSGGERQRVAIARAMITEPTCLLADEPTGNLDAANAKDVLELIIELNTDKTTALLIVTHDLSIANKMSRKLTLTNGEINET
jgi:lipoprotein-releasing system ATP-binding protein